MKLGEHLLIDIICDDILNMKDDILNMNSNILNSLEKLEELSDKLIKICNLTKLSSIKHKFDPQGITLITMLSESHISMHTWPENNSVCIDIFSCNNILNIEKVKETLHEYFMINKIIIKLVDRTISKL